MLLPIKPISEPKNVRRDGTTFIYIQYCYSSEKRKLLNTEIAIPPNFWNKNQLCIADKLPPSCGEVEHLNNELHRMVKLVQGLVSFAAKNKIEDRGLFVKNGFKPDFNIKTLDNNDASNIVKGREKKTNKDLYQQLDDYGTQKRKGLL
jgi:predicted RNA-binding protein YlxR (DUF448 family)